MFVNPRRISLDYVSGSSDAAPGFGSQALWIGHMIQLSDQGVSQASHSSTKYD